MTGQDPSGPDEFGDEDVPQPSDRFLAAMELSQTPEQQSIARQIYDRLHAGDDAENIEPLIEPMMRVVVDQHNGGRATGEDLPKQVDHPGVAGGVGQRHAGWEADQRDGLGAPLGQEHRGC